MHWALLLWWMLNPTVNHAVLYAQSKLSAAGSVVETVFEPTPRAILNTTTVIPNVVEGFDDKANQSSFFLRTLNIYIYRSRKFILSFLILTTGHSWMSQHVDNIDYAKVHPLFFKKLSVIVPELNVGKPTRHIPNKSQIRETQEYETSKLEIPRSNVLQMKVRTTIHIGWI